jgi:broad specificity phosphatase PhoE
MFEVKERAMAAVLDIVKENPNKIVVIATHGGVIKTIQSGAFGIPYDTLTTAPWATNASVTELDYDGSFKLVKFSYDEYLGELSTEMPRGI